MNHYTHLTIEEREKTRVLLERGLSIGAIGLALNRSKSTISREIARNSYKDGRYIAHHAQAISRKRKKNCGRKPILLEEKTRDYVIKRMELRWTPEQIAQRAKLENQLFSFSYATIYRAVDNGVLPKQLRKIMRFKRKNKKPKGNDKRGKIWDTTSIHDRPATANDRSELGHWESDTVLGMRKTGCLGTHVERKTGFLVAFYLPDRKDKIFNEATISAFQNMPSVLKKSFTVDNGKEFTHHKELSEKTEMDCYFCDPYSPWQRGTNENTNGLLRQFFPKGTSFAHITTELLQAVVLLINNRPRKRLGYKTPFEAIESFFENRCT